MNIVNLYTDTFCGRQNLKTGTKKTFNSCRNDSFTKSNDIAFGAKFLYKVKLKDRITKEPIQAQVFEMDFSKSDKNLLTRLLEKWKMTEYFYSIFSDYNEGRKSKYLAVALGESKSLDENNIKSLVEFQRGMIGRKKRCEVLYLQCSPEIANNPKSPIRGAGEVALFGVVKYAKKNKHSEIVLFSTNNEFYKRIGFIPEDEVCATMPCCNFSLENQDYDNFLKNVKAKYNF